MCSPDSSVVKNLPDTTYKQRQQQIINKLQDRMKVWGIKTGMNSVF